MTVEPHTFQFPENEAVALSISRERLCEMLGLEVCSECIHWDGSRKGGAIWEQAYPCGLKIEVAHDGKIALIMADRVEVDHVLWHLDSSEESIFWRRDDPETMEGETIWRAHRSWEIWREDDNGNQFFIDHASSERTALCKVNTFEKRGHKQTYFAKRAETG